MMAVGQFEPILVSEPLNDGRYEVVVGTHRLEAAENTGLGKP